jgi:hypothetical protein
MRAVSAKHSVITIEECSNDEKNNEEIKTVFVTKQISKRRRSSACELAILCGGGVAVASTFGHFTKEQQVKKKNRYEFGLKLALTNLFLDIRVQNPDIKYYFLF